MEYWSGVVSIWREAMRDPPHLCGAELILYYIYILCSISQILEINFTAPVVS